MREGSEPLGIQAAYVQVDDAMVDRLVDTPPNKLSDAIEALEVAGAPTVYLDKMWDGLHFLLTGVSASAPIEGNKLSEAIVGVHVFESEDFAGCTELDELPDVIAALEAAPLDELLAAARFTDFGAAEVYPNIWTDDPAQLSDELASAYRDLLAAHRACLSAGNHLVISIL
mgnify:FL=1